MENGVERPRAVSEHLIERMLAAGADRICMVMSPGKSDIMDYFGARIGGARIAYVVQAEPRGLCDAIFTALPFIRPEEEVTIGLPDTIWYPRDGLPQLPVGALAFLLFPVARPELFDAVVTDADDTVREIQVKRRDAASHWI